MTATALPEGETRVSPVERLEALCDPGSVRVLRSRVISTKLGDRATAGDGVVGGGGAVGGRPIVCYAQDGTYMGGSLGERHADTVVRVLETAGRAKVPVVAFVESGGPACRRAQPRSEGMAGSSATQSLSPASCRRSRSCPARPPGAARIHPH